MVLEDLFGGGTPVTIALEASLGTVANAERYYQKARKARQAREYLATRLHQAERLGQELARAREELSHVSHLDGLDAFERANLGLIQRLQSRGGEVAGSRFRRFSVGQGYTVWVSRSQRDADDLTFRCARKYDLWMHARGYSGAHVVLRLPHRDAAPGALLVEKAASIAAYFSKGRHSAFVPVIVTPANMYTSRGGAPPGMVTCVREKSLLSRRKVPLNEANARLATAPAPGCHALAAEIGKGETCTQIDHGSRYLDTQVHQTVCTGVPRGGTRDPAAHARHAGQRFRVKGRMHGIGSNCSARGQGDSRTLHRGATR